MNSGLEKKMRNIKWAYRVAAPSCLALGLWMVIAPSNFWGLIGVSESDVIVQTIYGAVLCGIGILCALGIRRPLHYLGAFQIMMAYKTVMCVALIPRLALMDDAPLGGWVIVILWASMAIASTLVYPWGRWKDIGRAMQEEG